MRRLLGLTMIALVSGLLISQSIAYLCAALAANAITGLTMDRPQQPLWPRFLHGFCPAPDVGAVGSDLGMGHSYTVRESPMPAPPDFRADPPKFLLYTESFGWPARSLVRYDARFLTRGSNGGAIDEPAFYDEFRARAGLGIGIRRPPWLPRMGRLQRGIPVLAIWPGLAMNAALYGAMTLGVCLIPRSLRRIRRRHRGECIQCGYPLAGLAVCPECGPQAGTLSTGP